MPGKPPPQIDEITRLKNLGPASAAWLHAVGIHHRADLAELGALAAFLRVRAAGFKPSLNLLYALEGALRDCHWAALPGDVRSSLLLGVDAADQSGD